MISKYLFILCPPYSGSTILYNILKTSPQISSLPDEAQHLPELQKYYGPRRWFRDPPIDWMDVKTQLHKYWDNSKPVLLEKSPPHLLHAFDLQQYFQPAYFIVLMRDPYANCDGFRRRMGITIERSAEFWQYCAKNQVNNLTALDNVIYAKYEDMVNYPLKLKEDILNFIREIGDITFNIRFTVHSIEGNKERNLYDYNKKNLLNLSNKDILKINSVLSTESELVTFFKYKIIYPTLSHAMGYWSNRLKNGVSRRVKKALSAK
jgi:hypothetical protein